MKCPALGHNPVINLRACIVRQENRAPTKSSENILKKMEFQEIVQDDSKTEKGRRQIMRQGYRDNRFEKQLVSSRWCFKNCVGAIHGAEKGYEFLSDIKKAKAILWKLGIHRMFGETDENGSFMVCGVSRLLRRDSES